MRSRGSTTFILGQFRSMSAIELIQVNNEIEQQVLRQPALPDLLLAATPLPADLIREIVGYDNELANLRLKAASLMSAIRILEEEAPPQDIQLPMPTRYRPNVKA